MRVEPVGDKVVVRRLEREPKTGGGIVLPDSAGQKPDQGRVLSLGDGVRLPNGARVSHQVKEGDRVLFSPYSGSELEVEGEKLLILSESEILAVLD